MKEITYNDLEAACDGLRTTPIERFNKRTGQKETKEYIDVAQRIKAFRRVYPMGYIVTSIIQSEPGIVTMQADVGYYDTDGSRITIATGMAQESQSASIINKTSYIENCETSAIGRALGMAGFGIDSGIASADEMQQALRQQEALEKAPPQKQTPKQSVPNAVNDTARPRSKAAAKLDPNKPITKDAAKKLSDMIVCIDAVDKSFWPQMQEAFCFKKSTEILQRDYNTITTQAAKRLVKLREDGVLDGDFKPIIPETALTEQAEEVPEEKKAKAKAKTEKAKAAQKAKAEAETGEQVTMDGDGFEGGETAW